MPAVEKGFKERIAKGVIAGFRVQNVCVEVFFGKHHPVDSSEQAFKTAASMAFKKVFDEADTSLLEPIVKMEITLPSDKVATADSDISSRRGRVLGMKSAGGDLQTVEVEVPLAEAPPTPAASPASPADRAAHHGAQPLQRRAGQHPPADHRQGGNQGERGNSRPARSRGGIQPIDALCQVLLNRTGDLRAQLPEDLPKEASAYDTW